MCFKSINKILFSHVQDQTAANYIREFEEAYRGLPVGYLHQQQQPLPSDLALDNNNRAESCCYGMLPQQHPTSPHNSSTNNNATTMMMVEAMQSSSSHCNEFFQPGEIFQLDHPITTTTNGGQFESLVNVGGGSRLYPSPSSSPPMMTTTSSSYRERFVGYHNQRRSTTAIESSSSSDDDINEDSMEFEPMIVHSDYPDIYTGAIPPMMMAGGDYHLGQKFNHHPPYPPAVTTGYSSAAEFDPLAYPEQHGSPRGGKYEDYLRTAGTDGGRGAMGDTEPAGWKYANTPPNHHPPHHPASMTSKYPEDSFRALSKQVTFSENDLHADFYRRQSSSPPVLLLRGAATADFADSVLL